MNSYLIPLALIAFISYVLWRRTVAVEARGKIAPKINDYLGKDNPDELKDLVHIIFTHSLNSFVPVFASIFFISRLFSAKSSEKEKLIDRHGKEKVDEAYKLIYTALFVNVMLSPISYFFYALIVISTLLLKIMLTVATRPIAPSREYNNVTSKVSSSMLKAVA